MKKIPVAIFLFSILLTACGKKINPAKQKNEKNTSASADSESSKDSVTVVIALPPKPPAPVKKTIPKFIILSDAVAKKAVDGRLYYDLEGKRYWKNYKDGKYYLYNKSMMSDPDYKPRH